MLFFCNYNLLELIHNKVSFLENHFIDNSPNIFYEHSKFLSVGTCKLFHSQEKGSYWLKVHFWKIGKEYCLKILRFVRFFQTVRKTSLRKYVSERVAN